MFDRILRKCVKHLLPGQREDEMAALDNIRQSTQVLLKRIQVDNGSEFIYKALNRWTYENKVTLDFSRPGKPTDNAFIESFDGNFRDERLKTN